MFPLLVFISPRESRPEDPEDEPRGSQFPEGFGYACLWWAGMIVLITVFGVGEYFLRMWIHK